MFTFIHLTDIHLVAGDEPLYGLNPAERLEACIADINARHADAAFCIVTGDLAHWGEPGAYARLRRALDRLAIPVHLMIGNHDDRGRFRQAFPECPVDAEGFVQFTLETPAGQFLLTDTAMPGVAHGDLCPRRLGWLAARLDEAAAADRPVFLFMHHPPVAVGLAGMDAIALRDPAALLAVLEPHRARVRHLFFGHLHRPVSGSWHGIPFSTLRGTSHQVALDFVAGAGIIRGSHEPPTYAVVRIDAAAVVVHVHDFLDRTASFDL